MAILQNLYLYIQVAAGLWTWIRVTANYLLTLEKYAHNYVSAMLVVQFEGLHGDYGQGCAIAGP